MPESSVQKHLRSADENLREWRWAFQRARRGYSDRDSWSACDYLCDVITGLLGRQRYASGYPSYLDTAEEWKEILDSIVTGFEAASRLMDEYPSGETRKRLEAEWKKGSKLFIKHFFSLWD